MTNLKKYSLFLISLLFAIIILRIVLKNGKKLPLVGKALGKADDIAFD